VKDLKRITKAPSLWRAVLMVWRAGLESFEQGEQVADLKARLARMEQELLTVSRLVHDYETKLHNHARENKDLAQAKQRLEWGYNALLLENNMLREEIFKLKGKPLS
jgi:chromosome segregation ATPase